MELKEKMTMILNQHGIDQEREIIIRSSSGSLYHIPINRLIDIISNLYKNQQKIIADKLDEIQTNVNMLMDFMYYLAKPLATIRI